MTSLHIKGSLLIIFIVYAITGGLVAAEVRWSVSPILGIHKPDLGLINDKVLGARLPITGELTFPGDDSARQVRYNVDNPLARIQAGTEAGLEFQMEINPKNHIVIGLSSWEGGSTSLVQTTLPFQGRLIDTVFERRVNISYLQYYLGWRRDLFVKHKKYKIYSRLMLNEVFDIDFRESFVFEFTNPDESDTTFKRITKLQTQATGHMMLQPAIGGEIFIRDWLSMGFDVGYAIGLNKFQLGSAQVSNDFQPQDTVNVRYPTAAASDGSQNLGYLADDEGTYAKMELDMNGWRTLFKINIYY